MHVHEAENDTTSGKATRGMIVLVRSLEIWLILLQVQD